MVTEEFPNYQEHMELKLFANQNIPLNYALINYKVKAE